jgi:hypothetical protein
MGMRIMTPGGPAPTWTVALKGLLDLPFPQGGLAQEAQGEGDVARLRQGAGVVEGGGGVVVLGHPPFYPRFGLCWRQA